MKENGIPYIQGIHIKGNSIKFTPNGYYYVDEEWSKKHPKSVLREHDILVVQTGSIGEVGIVPKEFDGANCHALLILRVIESHFFAKYLLYLLASEYGFISLRRITTGGILLHINGSRLKGIEVIQPHIKEQKAIANYLDTKTTQIDRKIDLLTQKAQRYEELKKSLINEVVTGKRRIDNGELIIEKKIDNGELIMENEGSGNCQLSTVNYPLYKDCGIEWIGEIPEHWKLKRHKDNFQLVTKRCEDRKLTKVGLENIQSQTGRFIETESEFDGDGIEFKPNDILFGKLRPYLAKVYLSDFRGSAVGDI